MIWGFLIPKWLKRAVAGAVALAVALLGVFQAGKVIERKDAKAAQEKRRADTLDEVMRRKDDAGQVSDEDLADRLSRPR